MISLSAQDDRSSRMLLSPRTVDEMTDESLTRSKPGLDLRLRRGQGRSHLGPRRVAHADRGRVNDGLLPSYSPCPAAARGPQGEPGKPTLLPRGRRQLVRDGWTPEYCPSFLCVSPCHEPRAATRTH